jgi:hypothetical protein
MGELDRVGVAGDEPGGDHLVDELLLDRVDDHLPAGHLAADRLTAGTGDDHPEDQIAQLGTLGVVQVRVQGLGGLRNRAADSTRSLVAGDRQGAALVP